MQQVYRLKNVTQCTTRTVTPLNHSSSTHLHRLHTVRLAIYVWPSDFLDSILYSWLFLPLFSLSFLHCTLVFSPRPVRFHHLGTLAASDPSLRVYDAAERLPVQVFDIPRTPRSNGHEPRSAFYAGAAPSECPAEFLFRFRLATHSARCANATQRRCSWCNYSDNVVVRVRFLIDHTSREPVSVSPA